MTLNSSLWHLSLCSSRWQISKCVRTSRGPRSHIYNLALSARQLTWPETSYVVKIVEIGIEWIMQVLGEDGIPSQIPKRDDRLVGLDATLFLSIPKGCPWRWDLYIRLGFPFPIPRLSFPPYCLSLAICLSQSYSDNVLWRVENPKEARFQTCTHSQCIIASVYWVLFWCNRFFSKSLTSLRYWHLVLWSGRDLVWLRTRNPL